MLRNSITWCRGSVSQACNAQFSTITFFQLPLFFFFQLVAEYSGCAHYYFRQQGLKDWGSAFWEVICLWGKKSKLATAGRYCLNSYNKWLLKGYNPGRARWSDSTGWKCQMKRATYGESAQRFRAFSRHASFPKSTSSPNWNSQTSSFGFLWRLKKRSERAPQQMGIPGRFLGQDDAWADSKRINRSDMGGRLVKRRTQGIPGRGTYLCKGIVVSGTL